MAASGSFEVGTLAKFGGYEWRVLEVRDGKALLLSREVVRTDTYNPSKGYTSWDICALRDWLNIDFYDEFSEQAQARIVETKVTTAKNPRFDTDCGETVSDNVFLLSVEEVARYFGDSGQLTGGNPKSKWWINDQFNAARQAYDENGIAVWWWLRTPGMHSNTAVYVNTGGSMNLAGHRAYNGDGGVRPAMWVNCKQESEQGIAIEKLHTTAMGEERIRRNLGLKSDDIIAWCRQAVRDADDSAVTRKGKNWYVICDDFTLTINAHSHTIITAHKTKRER